MAKAPTPGEWPGYPLVLRYMCHECMGYFSDGRQDCEVTGCPLYAKMPFRKLEPDYKFLAYNPKKKGLQDWDGALLAGNVAHGFRVVARAEQCTESPPAEDDWNKPLDNWETNAAVPAEDDWSELDDWETGSSNEPIVW